MTTKKNPFAVGLGKLGGKARAEALTAEQIAAISSKAGKVGGKARAQALTAEERSAIAKKAAATRWANRKKAKKAK